MTGARVAMGEAKGTEILAANEGGKDKGSTSSTLDLLRHGRKKALERAKAKEKERLEALLEEGRKEEAQAKRKAKESLEKRTEEEREEEEEERKMRTFTLEGGVSVMGGIGKNTGISAMIASLKKKKQGGGDGGGSSGTGKVLKSSKVTEYEDDFARAERLQRERVQQRRAQLASGGRYKEKLTNPSIRPGLHVRSVPAASSSSAVKSAGSAPASTTRATSARKTLGSSSVAYTGIHPLKRRKVIGPAGCSQPSSSSCSSSSCSSSSLSSSSSSVPPSSLHSRSAAGRGSGIGSSMSAGVEDEAMRESTWLPPEGPNRCYAFADSIILC